MSALPKPNMTIDEFVEWANDRDPDERWELVDGVPFKMMAPQRYIHGRIKAAVWLALRQAIADAKLPCEAVLDSVGVKIDENTGRIPDVSVQCDPIDDNAIWLTAPVILVEIVSLGSGTRDSRDKMVDYFTLPSVQHYLLVYPERRIVVHHRRGATEGEIATRIVETGAINLSPPGISVDIDAFFDDGTGASAAR